jgi:NADPH:quinone reductase-like Zn-dependent oxidoreductase
MNIPTIDPISLDQDDVLVAVNASSVNPVDWKIISSEIFPGTPATFPATIGMDISGTVVAVGASCTRIKPGDRYVVASLRDSKIFLGRHGIEPFL